MDYEHFSKAVGMRIIFSFKFQDCPSAAYISMDWQGQKLADLLMQIVLAVSALLALGTGYFMASFKLMLIIYAGGVLITLLITVPDWHFFNRHPLQWLDPKNVHITSAAAQNARSVPAKKPGKSVKK